MAGEAPSAAQQNSMNLLQSRYEWAQMGNNLGTGSYVTYALNTNFSFSLSNTSSFIRRIRIWLHGIDINVATADMDGLNRGGIMTLLGKSLEVTLGGHVYRISAFGLGLLRQTFSRHGHGPWYAGAYADNGYSSGYDYTPSLSGSKLATAVSTGFSYNIGDNLWQAYIDIDLALLRMVGDADGMAPTLSQSSLTVKFTTPSALSGSDATLYPLQSGGTGVATLGTAGPNSGPGLVSVWAEVPNLRVPFATDALPPFQVGPGFRVEEVDVAFVADRTFYKFQGDSANKTLVKSIIVINNPGELAGEFSNAAVNLTKFNLQYDSQKVLELHNSNTDPTNYNTFSVDAQLKNLMVDQRQAIGDQPNGVYVIDFSRGTNADYPNSEGYLDLETFQNAGVEMEYGGTIESGAQVKMFNVYLDESLYTAQ